MTAAIGALSVLLAACTTPIAFRADDGTIAGDSRSAREASLQQAWIGRRYQELVTTWGAPKMVLAVPGRHRPEEMVVVYGDRNSRAGCIDAFTVYNGEKREPNESSEIVSYSCR